MKTETKSEFIIVRVTKKEKVGMLNKAHDLKKTISQHVRKLMGLDK